ncbi:hypothetical protein K402DRAFT_229942 [Aulographum hederae CBS 113979]|uniref:Uncharacterized protein n=1 Tax=Aulographum hederae CBS 113979 TaxID=1176131 RepID=A0A6G1HB91_9PEZI|nr:hypothetical protein K402DRAFT_229942 [Aulographum hederae CBS 113979]
MNHSMRMHFPRSHFQNQTQTQIQTRFQRSSHHYPKSHYCCHRRNRSQSWSHFRYRDTDCRIYKCIRTSVLADTSMLARSLGREGSFECLCMCLFLSLSLFRSRNRNQSRRTTTHKYQPQENASSLKTTACRRHIPTLPFPHPPAKMRTLAAFDVSDEIYSFSTVTQLLIKNLW